MNLRVIIADDEPLSLSRLQRLVEKEQQATIVAKAKNGDELFRAIEQYLPDLVITDIRMPSKSGLEAALETCEKMPTPPAFIFCTAYSDYAIEAFKTLAVGYLVKPIDQETLSETIQRVGQLNQTQLNAAKNELGEQSRILIQAVGRVESLDLAHIDYFQANDKHVFAYSNGRAIAMDKSLKELEDNLGSEVVRAHRSVLVNVKRIERVFQEAGNGSFLETKGGHKLPVSRRMLSTVKQSFKLCFSS